MTPFDFWASAWRNAASMTQTGFEFAEMATASRAVIDSRTETIRSALENPMSADHAELGRMVPEKILAFSQGGMAAFGEMYRWQNDAWAQWQQVAGMMMAGRLPRMSQIEAMTARSMRMGTKAASAGSKALAPIHKAATGNARRLSASTRSRSG